MSEFAVQVKDVTKVYRLYTRPIYRMLDLFGLLGQRPGTYTEHAALAGVTLQIRRGEKVGLIGRNGAGKSTFLKILTSVIKPTSGEVHVAGETSALLQIGTGFHPDFTGRQNVLAYLACIGVTGKQARRSLAEIIDFTELDEYIDQPFKTYSTGMGTRLMFATSTAIAPEILVLDEILGVGDAYFARKSFDRIKDICEKKGTTVLLVSHDIYSATQLCDRMIWLERGRVALDRDCVSVIHAYETSIRNQEEDRLRQRRLEVLRDNAESGAASHVLIGQIHCRQRTSPTDAIPIAVLRFLRGGQELACLHTENAASDSMRLLLEPGEGNWSAVKTIVGRAAREFAPHGSIYHRVPFLVTDRAVVEAAEAGQLECEIEHLGAHAQPLELALYLPGKKQFRGVLPVTAVSQWTTLRTRLQSVTAQDQTIDVPEGLVRYGTKAVEITDVQFLDGAGQESHFFDIGSSMTVRLSYRINDAELDECPTIAVGFMRDGLHRSHRFWTDQVRLSARQANQGTLEIQATPLLMGPGTYLVTVWVFRAGNFQAKGAARFFSANDQLHDCHSRAYEIMIKEDRSRPLCNDVIYQHPVTWKHQPRHASAEEIRRKSA